MSVGLIVKLTARPEKADDLRELLSGALELARAEAGTPIWIAAQTGPTAFWIVDTHTTDADRQIHLDGPIAAALTARADELLSEPPSIEHSTILAAKP